MRLPTLISMPFTGYNVSEGTAECPLCGDTEAEVIATLDRRFKHLEQGRCLTCGLVRHIPLPTEAALARYYATEYRADYHLVFRAPTEAKRQKRLRAASKRVERLSAALPGASSVIDFGCGSGEFIESCISAGHTGAGFEPGEDYAAYARNERGLNVQQGRWQDVTFDEPVDAVTSFHVFEHLVDPKSALERILTWLKPDGVVYLETPNALNGVKRKGVASLHFAHTLGFTRYTLEALGAQAGLETVAVYDEYDIGIVFRRGTPRPLEEIYADAQREWEPWTKSRVHSQFPKYLWNKLTGRIGKVT